MISFKQKGSPSVKIYHCVHYSSATTLRCPHSTEKHLWFRDQEGLLVAGELHSTWSFIEIFCVAKTASTLPISILPSFLATEPWSYSG